ncbi:hypothetical protein N657DRAFT_651061 [Parathielavia appendiculata]|uniref:Uncharacterized protein n=1 Tax=Parathielavia appendiculata TaxID=2587402 RepID=A0AAN6TR62_9PEZI|nr:hypothetical protein N657DRAFT_651061 [Parathielavia appendiculata]
MMLSPVPGRVQLRACKIHRIQHLLNSTHRTGIAARYQRSLTTSSPLRPTTSSPLNASMAPPFFRRIFSHGRKSRSTESEPQPEPASSPRPTMPDCTSDDTKVDNGLHQNSQREREATEASSQTAIFDREAEVAEPMFFLKANFPEDDGFRYTFPPFRRGTSYTRKEGGEEVVVTIPERHISIIQASRFSNSQIRVNGIKQNGTACLVVATSEALSEGAVDAVKQFLLGYFALLQDLEHDVEGCMGVVFVGGKIGIYEYSSTKGLHSPPEQVVRATMEKYHQMHETFGFSPPRDLLPESQSMPRYWQPEGEREREATEANPKTKVFDPKINDSGTGLGLQSPSIYLMANMPEDDGFVHTYPPTTRDIRYTKREGGEEVTVTIPRDRTSLCLATKTGQSTPACIGLAAVLPAEEDLSENAVDAIKQALLEYILLQDPVVTYCIAVVFIGGRTGTYWYVREEGLHLSDFPEHIAESGMKTDQYLRLQLGFPPRYLLRDSRSEPQPEHALSPRREANNPASSQYLRDMPLRIPLAIFQTLWPKERGFGHVDLGYLERDIHYIERNEVGEEVSVTIPWKDTRLYVAVNLNLTVPQAMCVVLYAMPPAVTSSGGPNNAETPWGRGISDVAMGAVMYELEAVIKQFLDAGYNGGHRWDEIYVDGCVVLSIMGLRMVSGHYYTKKGFVWFQTAPVVTEEHGLAQALDPAHYNRVL